MEQLCLSGVKFDQLEVPVKFMRKQDDAGQPNSMKEAQAVFEKGVETAQLELKQGSEASLPDVQARTSHMIGGSFDPWSLGNDEKAQGHISEEEAIAVWQLACEYPSARAIALSKVRSGIDASFDVDRYKATLEALDRFGARERAFAESVKFSGPVQAVQQLVDDADKTASDRFQGDGSMNALLWLCHEGAPDTPAIRGRAAQEDAEMAKHEHAQKHGLGDFVNTEVADAVKLLLENSEENGKDVQHKSSATPVWFAAERGDLEVVRALCAQRAQLGALKPFEASAAHDGPKTLGRAFSFATKKAVEAEDGLQLPPDLFSKRSVFHVPSELSSSGWNKRLAKLVTKTQVKGALTGEFPSAYAVAAAKGQHEVLALLKEAHGDRDDNDGEIGRALLEIACRAGNFNEIDRVLKNFPDVDVNRKFELCGGQTPLLLVVQGHEDAGRGVELLLAKGAEVDAVNDTGKTALSIAANEGHLLEIRALLRGAADIDLSDNDGVAPVHIAAASDANHKALSALLQVQHSHQSLASVEQFEREDKQHIAHKSTETDVGDISLEGRHRLNAKTNSGLSPVQIAAMSGAVKNLELLLEQGADYLILSPLEQWLTDEGLARFNKAFRKKQLTLEDMLKISAESDLKSAIRSIITGGRRSSIFNSDTDDGTTEVTQNFKTINADVAEINRAFHNQEKKMYQQKLEEQRKQQVGYKSAEAGKQEAEQNAAVKNETEQVQRAPLELAIEGHHANCVNMLVRIKPDSLDGLLSEGSQNFLPRLLAVAIRSKTPDVGLALDAICRVLDSAELPRLLRIKSDGLAPLQHCMARLAEFGEDCELKESDRETARSEDPEHARERFAESASVPTGAHGQHKAATVDDLSRILSALHMPPATFSAMIEGLQQKMMQGGRRRGGDMLTTQPTITMKEFVNWYEGEDSKEFRVHRHHHHVWIKAQDDRILHDLKKLAILLAKCGADVFPLLTIHRGWTPTDMQSVQAYVLGTGKYKAYNHDPAHYLRADNFLWQQYDPMSKFLGLARFLNVSSRNSHPDKMPILSYAVKLGKDAWIEELLKNGADPRVRDRHGNTALHIACAARPVKLRTVKLLLERCDDKREMIKLVNVQNRQKKVAIELLPSKVVEDQMFDLVKLANIALNFDSDKLIDAVFDAYDEDRAGFMTRTEHDKYLREIGYARSTAPAWLKARVGADGNADVKDGDSPRLETADEVWHRHLDLTQSGDTNKSANDTVYSCDPTWTEDSDGHISRVDFKKLFNLMEADRDPFWDQFKVPRPWLKVAGCQNRSKHKKFRFLLVDYAEFLDENRLTGLDGNKIDWEDKLEALEAMGIVDEEKWAQAANQLPGDILNGHSIRDFIWKFGQKIVHPKAMLREKFGYRSGVVRAQVSRGSMNDALKKDGISWDGSGMIREGRCADGFTWDVNVIFDAGDTANSMSWQQTESAKDGVLDLNELVAMRLAMLQQERSEKWLERAEASACDMVKNRLLLQCACLLAQVGEVAAGGDDDVLHLSDATKSAGKAPYTIDKDINPKEDANDPTGDLKLAKKHARRFFRHDDLTSSHEMKVLCHWDDPQEQTDRLKAGGGKRKRGGKTAKEQAKAILADCGTDDNETRESKKRTEKLYQALIHILGDDEEALVEPTTVKHALIVVLVNEEKFDLRKEATELEAVVAQVYDVHDYIPSELDRQADWARRQTWLVFYRVLMQMHATWYSFTMLVRPNVTVGEIPVRIAISSLTDVVSTQVVAWCVNLAIIGFMFTVRRSIVAIAIPALILSGYVLFAFMSAYKVFHKESHGPQPVEWKQKLAELKDNVSDLNVQTRGIAWQIKAKQAHLRTTRAQKYMSMLDPTAKPHSNVTAEMIEASEIEPAVKANLKCLLEVSAKDNELHNGHVVKGSALSRDQLCEVLMDRKERLFVGLRGNESENPLAEDFNGTESTKRKHGINAAYLLMIVNSEQRRSRTRRTILRFFPLGFLEQDLEETSEITRDMINGSSVWKHMKDTCTHLVEAAEARDQPLLVHELTEVLSEHKYGLWSHPDLHAEHENMRQATAQKRKSTQHKAVWTTAAYHTMLAKKDAESCEELDKTHKRSHLLKIHGPSHAIAHLLKSATLKGHGHHLGHTQETTAKTHLAHLANERAQKENDQLHDMLKMDYPSTRFTETRGKIVQQTREEGGVYVAKYDHPKSVRRFDPRNITATAPAFATAPAIIWQMFILMSFSFQSLENDNSVTAVNQTGVRKCGQGPETDGCWYTKPPTVYGQKCVTCAPNSEFGHKCAPYVLVLSSVKYQDPHTKLTTRFNSTTMSAWDVGQYSGAMTDCQIEATPELARMAKVARLLAFDIPGIAAVMEYAEDFADSPLITALLANVQFWNFCGVVTFWLFYYAGFITTGLMWQANSKMREKLAYISPDFFSFIPGAKDIVPVLSQAMYVPVMQNILTPLDCTKVCDPSGPSTGTGPACGPDGGIIAGSLTKYTLDINPNVECWTGKGHHRVMVMLVLLLLPAYQCTTALIGLSFLETTDNSTEVRFRGDYVALTTSIKATMIVVGMVATESPVITLVSSLIGTTLMAGLAFLMQPCQNISWVNQLIVGTYSVAVWTNIALWINLDPLGINLSVLEQWKRPITIGGWIFLSIGTGVRVFRAAKETTVIQELEVLVRRYPHLASDLPEDWRTSSNWRTRDRVARRRKRLTMKVDESGATSEARVLLN